jgi:tRNA G18 (ribose-2'-O)-methylase SpoU
MITGQLTSAKNPLLKEVRRAIARGSLTTEGFCIAETFHLLEEALRSDCFIPTVITAESVRTTVEAHVKGLKQVNLIRVPDALFAEISATESRTQATPAPSSVPPRPLAPPAPSFSRAR